MNEVSNFDTNVYEDKLQCPENRWDDPPYGTSALNFVEFFLAYRLCSIVMKNPGKIPFQYLVLYCKKFHLIF